jgi:hypothetical protein
MVAYIFSFSKKETCGPAVAPSGYMYDMKCIESRSF